MAHGRTVHHPKEGVRAGKTGNCLLTKNNENTMVPKGVPVFAVELYRHRISLRKAVSRVAEEMVPKSVVDILVQQISSLQATVDRLTATIEEKDQIIAEKIEIILN